MKPAATLLLAACLAAPTARAEEKPRPTLAPALHPRNLVKNPSLEEKHPDWGGPRFWDRPDGLTMFWEKHPAGSGLAMRFDTDVLLSEFERRQKEMQQVPIPPPWAKTPSGKNKYGTVAGFDGVAFYSDPIPVQPGVRYVLSARTLSPRTQIKLFVKGYAMFEGRKRILYKAHKDCAHSKDWVTNVRTFHPTDRTPLVSEIRVVLYSYWAPGECWVDDVQVYPEEQPADAKEKKE